MKTILMNPLFFNAKNNTSVFFKGATFSKTYSDLFSDVQILKENLGSSRNLGLAFTSPYEMFVAILASMTNGMTPTLISGLTPPAQFLDIQNRYQLDAIITSLDFKGTNTIEKTGPQETIGLNVLSSGSTGEPKQIFLSILNLKESAANFNDFFKAKENDIFLLNLPHHHVGGLMILWRAFFSGACVSTIIDEPFDFISLVPLQFQRMLGKQETLDYLKAARVILIGGAPFSDELKEKADQLQLKTYETYGMSETASFVMLNGIPLKNVELKLSVDSRFMIKSSALSSSVPLDKDGFYLTNDIGTRLIDNSFKFIQRSDLLFKSAGELINPLEVEEEIKKLPYIKNAVCVAIPHYKWTNALVCIFELKEDFAKEKIEKKIKDDLKKSINPYLVPKYFYEAQADHFISGLKPKRYELKKFAIQQFLSNLFSFEFLDNQSDELLVAFHGFMESFSDLKKITKQKRNDNYLFIDLPGHGKSDAFKFTHQDEVYFYLNELIAYFNQHSRPVTVYGYSMGGRVSLELMARGLNVKELILESANFGLKSLEEKRQRLKSDSSLLKDVHDLKSFFDSWYDNPIFNGYKTSLGFNEALAHKVSHDKDQWQKALEFFSPGASAYTLFEMIKLLESISILGITGSLDEKYTQIYKDVQLQLPRFRHFIIEGAGHNPHKTHMEDILKILNQR